MWRFGSQWPSPVCASEISVVQSWLGHPTTLGLHLLRAFLWFSFDQSSSDLNVETSLSTNTLPQYLWSTASALKPAQSAPFMNKVPDAWDDEWSTAADVQVRNQPSFDISHVYWLLWRRLSSLQRPSPRRPRQSRLKHRNEQRKQNLTVSYGLKRM